LPTVLHKPTDDRKVRVAAAVTTGVATAGS
jgi:hypothetical protein